MTQHQQPQPRRTGARARWSGAARPAGRGGCSPRASPSTSGTRTGRARTGSAPGWPLTGTYCPGCGGLRAVNDLTNGDVAAAASSNLLFVGSLPFIAVWWLRSFADGWRGVQRRVSDRTAYVVLAVVLALTMVFWVVRNVPFAGWLAP